MYVWVKLLMHCVQVPSHLFRPYCSQESISFGQKAKQFMTIQLWVLMWAYFRRQSTSTNDPVRYHCLLTNHLSLLCLCICIALVFFVFVFLNVPNIQPISPKEKNCISFPSYLHLLIIMTFPVQNTPADAENGISWGLVHA